MDRPDAGLHVSPDRVAVPVANFGCACGSKVEGRGGGAPGVGAAAAARGRGEQPPAAKRAGGNRQDHRAGGDGEGRRQAAVGEAGAWRASSPVCE